MEKPYITTMDMEVLASVLHMGVFSMSSTTYFYQIRLTKIRR
jgi:hypothetical protein